MRVATIVSLGASALLGIGALAVAKIWLPQTAGGPGKAVAAVSPANLTPVVAAAKDIPFGVKLTAKDLTIIQLPKDAVPEGAYTTIEEVTALDGGAPVSLARITAREPLLPAKLSGGGVKANVAATLAPGMRAYTIKVDDVTGGGGHVTPGDRVDVLVAMEPPAGAYKAEGAQTKVVVSGPVLQNIRVLGMDLVADPANVDKFVPKTATLEVSMEDAAKLAVAADLGTLSLALRRTGEVSIEPAGPIKRLDFGGGGGELAPRPAAAPKRRKPAGPKPVSSESTLTVVQGSERTTVQVPTDRQGGW